MHSSLQNQRLYNRCSFPVPSEPAKEAPADSKPLADAPEAPKKPVLAEETKEEAPQEEEEQVRDIIADEICLRVLRFEWCVDYVHFQFRLVIFSCGKLTPVQPPKFGLHNRCRPKFLITEKNIHYFLLPVHTFLPSFYFFSYIY